MSQNRVISIAVSATAATCLILAGISLYFFYRYFMSRQRERKKHASSFRREATPAVVSPEELMQQGGTLRGLIIEENGRDVLYLRKAEGGRLSSCFSKVWFNHMIEEEKEIMDDRGLNPGTSSPIQEIPLLSGSDFEIDYFDVEKKRMEVSGPSNFPPPPPHPPPPPPPPPLPPPPPPPPPPRAPPPPPKPPVAPPQPPPVKRFSKPPVQSVASSKKTPGSSSLLKPPAPPGRGKLTINHRSETSGLENPNEKGDAQMKLKPLHWDKVPTNAEHSMVWHEIVDGSFRFDDQLIEALFGYTAQNQKANEARNSSTSSATSNPSPPSQIFLLDPRKSQNTAIVLKSLATSRKEILEALQEGHGLGADTLEKLTRISPTPEEAAKLLQFDGNPTKLADAESFLYHVLKAVPTAFIRINAMLFRSSYEPDILHLKESLQTLELSCKELRNRGIFLKLLEAILKAGNRMNAGTSRGDAQGFNLTALRKLSYVKSTDGKTTLLQFVVEQVIRSEGKRCANIQDHKSSNINNGISDFGNQDLSMKTAKEEVDKENLMLGLPVVASLSTEFSNVKKAATIDYEIFINMCPALTARIRDIRQLVSRCGSNERSGFVREMKGFLEECEDELKVVREEQTRVMQLVKRTTEYYQAGAVKDKGTDPLQLFGIVKDFLSMVDQVCVDVSKKLQKNNVTSTGSSPPLPLSPKAPVKFQNMQSYLVREKQGTMSNESEDDFSEAL